MKNSKRTKMSIEDRAKQFAPFSPLRGLHEALKQMERVVVPKAELSEERAEELNRALLQIQKGDMVTAVYYSEGEYVKITGKVARLSIDEKFLQVVDKKIHLENLYTIEKA